MSTAVIIASTVVATVALLPVVRRALWPTHPKIIPSPLSTLIPRLSDEEMKRLEYKPEAFPGARDVLTPVSSSSRLPIASNIQVPKLKPISTSMALSAFMNGARRMVPRSFLFTASARRA